MYDFIGDIHGHADKLEALLEKLGYKVHGGVFQHPTRKAFFLGDFIDRGPKIREVLNIVIPMIESGAALSVMGNHEFNYLGFYTPNKSNSAYLRPRNDKNIKECSGTIYQLSGDENKRLLNWIWTIPLFYETEAFRAVHACWDQDHIKILSDKSSNNKLNVDLLHECFDKKTKAYESLEIILKGPEVSLPPELHFKDSYEKLRTEGRVCWWDMNRKVVVPPKDIDPEVYQREMSKFTITPPLIDRPTFFGHYWESGTPQITNPKAACLDYSVAKKGGNLCCYRFDGEKELSSDKLVWV
jgi:hypothetical protein